MKFTKLLLVFSALIFTAALTAGCGRSQENTVIESTPMTAEEEAVYEEQTYGSIDDEAQN